MLIWFCISIFLNLYSNDAKEIPIYCDSSVFNKSDSQARTYDCKIDGEYISNGDVLSVDIFRPQRVTKVALIRCTVDNISLNFFQRFTNLRVLLVYNSHIDIQTFERLPYKKKLLELNVENCAGLKELSSNMFRDFVLLWYLNLNDVKTRVINIGVFAGLFNLKHLAIGNANLTILCRSMFKDLVNLENLFFAQCQIEVLEEHLFFRNSKLKQLYLNNNRIKTVSGVFEQFDDLTEI